jgi:hypothetical protein
MKKPLAGLLLAALLVVLDASTALAVTKTWAATGPGPANWSAGASWQGGNAPQAGDDLVFPSPGATLTTKTVNNFASTTSFNSLTLSGDYDIAGNGFHLDGVSPTAALTVAAGQKPAIHTGAIFVHQSSANGTSQVSLGAQSVLDMKATPQVTVGGAPPNITNFVLTATGAGGQLFGPSSLDFDTFHLTGSATFFPQLLTQNANTPGTVLTDAGTLIATTQNAGASISSSSSITINGDLLEAVSAASTGGLDFTGPVTFGTTANVRWEAFNSNADNVINFNQGVNLSPAKFLIQLPAGFAPYAQNAVYPVITSQGPAFTPATEFVNMKEGQTQTVAGYVFTAEYNVPDPGDFRVVVSGPPPAVPAPPATGALRPSPPAPPVPSGLLFALALLLVTATGAYRLMRG